MVVDKDKFIKLVQEECYGLYFFAKEIGMSVKELKQRLWKKQPFSMEETRQILAMFGAEKVEPTIDWEAQKNVRSSE